MRHRIWTFLRLFEMAVRGFFYDHCTAASASLAFYGLFSGFPLLLLSITAAAAVLDPDRAADRVQEVLRAWVPISSGLVESGVRGAVEAGGGVFGYSIIALLWSGTRVFAQITRALNEAWDVPHNYKLRYRLFIEPLLVSVTVALIAASLLYRPVLTQTWTSLTGQPALPGGPVWNFAGETWVKGLGFLIVLLLYRYVPRRNVSWRDAVPGALLTMVLFQVSQEGFERYIEQYDERYTRVFGPLSSIVVLLLWAYITAAIFLFGAEYSSAHCNLREGRDARGEDAPVVDKVAEEASEHSAS
ncbi:MAG: YihY/virulence factor BrkB family protein [Chloroflexota bacterium]|nr:YihY/virulence factor BrkB family protein [Chloroflexota bacterium]